MSASVEDRVQAMVLGGAVGDGWGRPYEGSVGHSFPLPLELVVTDDTQLTLATCEALIENRGVDSVPLALFAARAIGRRNFVQVVGSAIAAGGDTDTIGSITGQIAGAAVGASGLPDDVLDRLRDRVEIADVAQTFARVVMAQ